MATRDGLAQIWYADANGVVTGYTPTADNVASAIIDAYNEHYGTDINIWTPETKNLQVGDTVPNWNAYEKIELPKQYVKTDLGQSNYAFGFIQNKSLKVYGPVANSFYSANSGGEILSSSENVTPMLNGVFIPRLRAQGYDVVTGEIQSGVYEIGDHVDNWENYNIITS